MGPTPEEKASGFIGPNVLLAAAIIKLRDKHGLFGAALTGTPTPARAAGSDEPSISAKEFLEEMTAVNHRMMMMSDQEISDDSKKVWMKTMTDIEALARIGAVAPRAERRPDSSGWDSD